MVLLSGDFYDILSPDVQKLTREIDTVTVKGSLKPMKLYTVTLILDHIKPVTFEPESRETRELKKDQVLKRLKNGERTTWELILRDEEIIDMRRGVNFRAEKLFAKGYKNYIFFIRHPFSASTEELFRVYNFDYFCSNLNKTRCSTKEYF